MFENETSPRSKGVAVLLGRGYGDAMQSTPLLLRYSDIVQAQREPHHRAFALVLVGLAGVMILATSVIIIKRHEVSFYRHIALGLLEPFQLNGWHNPNAASASTLRRSIIKDTTGSTRGDPEALGAKGSQRSAASKVLDTTVTQIASNSTKRAAKEDPTVVSSKANTRFTRKQLYRRAPQSANFIEPYRNGMIAKPLKGEALRMALIEDRKLTREMNQAALRALLDSQQSK